MKIREQLIHPPDRLWHSTNALILGKPGSGKTRVASTVGRISFDQPSSLLVIDQDNGAGGQKFANPALLPESFDEYKDLLSLITTTVKYQDPPYKMGFLNREWTFNGLLIDTLNRMQDIIKKGIKGGYISNTRLKIQDYGSMLDDLLGFILALKELSESKPFHLVLTAQIAPDKITLRAGKNEDDQAGAYYWLPSLAGSIGPKLAEHVDIVLTTYRDPATRKWQVYGVDTVTDMGTFAGKLRYLDFYKGSPENMPHTWWDILKQHGVNVSDPVSIGKLDTPVKIEQHWSEINKNRTGIEGLLVKSNIPIEALFKACKVDDWEDMTSYEGTGQEAFNSAKEYWQSQEGQQQEEVKDLEPEEVPF